MLIGETEVAQLTANVSARNKRQNKSVIFQRDSLSLSLAQKDTGRGVNRMELYFYY